MYKKFMHGIAILYELLKKKINNFYNEQCIFVM